MRVEKKKLDASPQGRGNALLANGIDSRERAARADGRSGHRAWPAKSRQHCRISALEVSWESFTSDRRANSLREMQARYCCELSKQLPRQTTRGRFRFMRQNRGNAASRLFGRLFSL
jgi:hypothetical protein